MKYTPYILVLLMVLLPLSTAQAANWCSPDNPPTINVHTSTDQISYNFSLSEKQLNKFSVSTVNPYGDNIITDVGGLMKGGIETQQRMSFGTLTNSGTNEICYWYDTMDIYIHIKPTIYIANEFPRNSCMHNSIMEHEQKHVMVDREIVNKYAKLIGDAVRSDISKNTLFGPVPLSQQSALQSKIKQRMQYILTQYTNQMSTERKKRQQQIDSLQEYERVNNLCPKENRKR